jgi:hypothetical protein
LFNLKAIADQSPEIVQQILGAPSELQARTFTSRAGKSYPTQRAKYKGETVEITFIDNGARYVTVFLSVCAEYRRLNETTQKCVKERHTGYGWYPYPKAAWTLLGDLSLDGNTTAEFSNQFTTRWQNLSGIHEINVFPLITHIHYAHVLTTRDDMNNCARLRLLDLEGPVGGLKKAPQRSQRAVLRT